MAVVTALARARGQEVDEEDVEWAKRNSSGSAGNVFDTITAILTKGLEGTDCVLLINEDSAQSSVIHKLQATSITQLDLASLCALGSAPLLSWSRASRKITAYQPKS